MKKMFLLFSHVLSEEQENDARKNLKINEFVSLDKDLQIIWSNISPDIPSVKEHLNPIKTFLLNNLQSNDIVLIQGEFGAVYEMVNIVKVYM